mmetsp:Transcript_13409/g.38107  ORF Transcript_13409/g.38107 Transcript_13409/m.38107 type:complete len:200 (-) Transcript_13409:956-1555(-)
MSSALSRSNAQARGHGSSMCMKLRCLSCMNSTKSRWNGAPFLLPKTMGAPNVTDLTRAAPRNSGCAWTWRISSVAYIPPSECPATTSSRHPLPEGASAQCSLNILAESSSYISSWSTREAPPCAKCSWQFMNELLMSWKFHLATSWKVLLPLKIRRSTLSAGNSAVTMAYVADPSPVRFSLNTTASPPTTMRGKASETW